MPTRGVQGTSAWSQTCPSNQLIVGFGGRAGALIDQLVLRCAPLIVTADGGGFTVSTGATTDLAAVGGTGGNPFAQTDCAAGQIASTARLRAGDGIDAFGLACTTPTVQ
jgi:hypothetical protein